MAQCFDVRWRPEGLLAVLALIAEGEMLFAPAVTRRLVETLARQPEVKREQPASLGGLTDRETDVLVLAGMASAGPAPRALARDADQDAPP
ncbi:hypothetical protein [Streptomyces sp. NPDC001743]|uniref:hypothetical protein n=1 Tax=Streptomyces sp. NPDC001743 TaxID=3154397 RepID=UPI00332AE515